MPHASARRLPRQARGAVPRGAGVSQRARRGDEFRRRSWGREDRAAYCTSSLPARANRLCSLGRVSGSCHVCASTREVPHRVTVRYLLFWYLNTGLPLAEPRRTRAAGPRPPRAAAAGAGGPRRGRAARPAPQRAALQPRVGGEQKRVIRRETSRNVHVRLTVIRKRVNQLAIYQHLDRNTCSSVAALLTVSSKSDSSSRGACSFCAHSASRAASACWSAPLVSCHEFSLRATTGAHFPRSTLVSAVLFWSKSNDRRARTCSVAVVSTVDAAPAVRRASARAGASCVAVCMPRARRVGGGTWRDVRRFTLAPRFPVC